MYKEFFGLKEMPFSLTPDPRFIIFTPGYNEVLASLYYGLENAKGLIVVTGEVGTGKTTALRWMLRRLDSSVLAAYMFNPRLSVEEFYTQLTQMFGVKEWTNKAELLTMLGRMLEDRHRRGLRTVLVIDEAHDLSEYLLEEVRLLLNFESDNAKHLQIILTGQPELRDKLNLPSLRQLKQRVALRCTVPALKSAEEVEKYIIERLTAVGSRQPNVFTPGALDLIFKASEGIPRQVNNICDNSFLAAYASGEPIIGRRIVEEVCRNFDMLPDNEQLMSHDSELDNVPMGPVMTEDAREELQNLQRGTETVSPQVVAAVPEPQPAPQIPPPSAATNETPSIFQAGFEPPRPQRITTDIPQPVAQPAGPASFADFALDIPAREPAPKTSSGVFESQLVVPAPPPRQQASVFESELVVPAQMREKYPTLGGNHDEGRAETDKVGGFY